MMLLEMLFLLFCYLIPLEVTGLDVQPSEVVVLIDGTNSVSEAIKLQMEAMVDSIENMLPSNSHLNVGYIGETFSKEKDLSDQTRHRKNVPESYGTFIDSELLGTILVNKFPDSKNKRTAEIFILLVSRTSKLNGKMPDIVSSKKTIVIQFGPKKNKFWTAMASISDLDLLIKQPEDVQEIEGSLKEQLAHMSEYVCDTNQYTLNRGPRDHVYIMRQCLTCDNLCNFKVISDVTDGCSLECKYHPGFKKQEPTKPFVTPEDRMDVGIDRRIIIGVCALVICLVAGGCLCYKFDVHKWCHQQFCKKNKQAINNTVGYQPAANGDTVIHIDGGNDDTSPMMPDDDIDGGGELDDETDGDPDDEHDGTDAEHNENDVENNDDEDENINHDDDLDGGGHSNHEDCLIKNPKELQQNLDAIGNIPIHSAQPVVGPDGSDSDDNGGEMDDLLTTYGYRDRGMDVSNQGNDEENNGTDEENDDLDEEHNDLDDGNNDLYEANIDLDEENDDLDEANNDLDEGNIDLDEGNIDLDEGNIDLDEGNIDLDEGNIDLDEGNIDLDEANNDLDEENDDLDEANNDLDEGNIDLDEGNIDLDEGNIDLDEGNIDLDEGNIDLDEGNIDLDEANNDLDEENDDLDEANNDLDEGNIDLDEGNIDLDEGNIDLDEGNICHVDDNSNHDNSNDKDCLIKNPKELQKNLDAIGTLPVHPRGVGL